MYNRPTSAPLGNNQPARTRRPETPDGIQSPYTPRTPGSAKRFTRTNSRPQKGDTITSGHERCQGDKAKTRECSQPSSRNWEQYYIVDNQNVVPVGCRGSDKMAGDQYGQKLEIDVVRQCPYDVSDGIRQRIREECNVLRQDFEKSTAQVKVELKSLMEGEFSQVQTKLLQLLVETKKNSRGADVDLKPLIAEIHKVKKDLHHDIMNSQVSLHPVMEKLESLAKTQARQDFAGLLHRIDSLKLDESFLSPVLEQNKQMVELLSKIENHTFAARGTGSHTMGPAHDRKGGHDKSDKNKELLEAMSRIERQTLTTARECQRDVQEVLETVQRVHLTALNKDDLKPVLNQVAQVSNGMQESRKSTVDALMELKESLPQGLSKDTMERSLLELEENIREEVRRLQSNARRQSKTLSSNANAEVDLSSSLLLKKLDAIQTSIERMPTSLLDRLGALQDAVDDMNPRQGFEQVSKAIAAIDLSNIEQKVDNLEDLLRGLDKQIVNLPTAGIIRQEMQSCRDGVILQKIDALKVNTSKHFKKLEEMPAVLKDVESAVRSKMQDLEKIISEQSKHGQAGGSMDLTSIRDSILSEVHSQRAEVDFTEVLDEIKKVKIRGLNPELVLERIDDLKLMQKAYTERVDDLFFKPVMHQIQCINTTQNELRSILWDKLEDSLDLSPILNAIKSADQDVISQTSSILSELRRVMFKLEESAQVMEKVDVLKSKLDANFKPLFHQLKNMTFDPDFKPIFQRVDVVHKAVVNNKCQVDLSPVMQAIEKLTIEFQNNKVQNGRRKSSDKQEDPESPLFGSPRSRSPRPPDSSSTRSPDSSLQKMPQGLNSPQIKRGEFPDVQNKTLF